MTCSRVIAAVTVLAFSALAVVRRARADETTVLVFPQDRVVGKLYLRDAGFRIDDWTSASNGWTEWTSARGILRVPAGKVVRFDLNRAGAQNPEFLKSLSPSSFVMFNAERHNANDNMLGAIAHLTGVRILEIDYNPLTDDGVAALSCLPSVEALDVDDTDVGLDAAPWLDQMKSLKLLALRRTQLSDRAFNRLGQTKGLIGLDISGTPVSDETVRDLAYITGLAKLDLSKTKISDAGLRHLSNLKSLKSVALSGTRISDDGLSAFSGLRELQEIDLRGVAIRGPGLANLTQAAGLRKLVFQGRLNDESLAYLGQLQQLEELVLDDCRATDVGMRHLKQFSNIRKLVLDAPAVTGEGLAVLKEMTKLESVSIDHCKVTDQNLTTLASIGSLKTLRLSGSTVTDEGLRAIGGMERLEELQLGRALTWHGLAHLGDCSNLKSLHLVADVSGRPSLEFLTKLRSLERLHLRTAGIDARELSHLERMPNLKILLTTGNFDDDQASAVAKSTSIDQLYLSFGAKLTDSGLRELAKMAQLEKLRMDGEITDAGLVSLAPLKNLKWLQCQSPLISIDGVRELGKKLPYLEHFYSRHGDAYTAPGIDSERTRMVGEVAPDFTVELLDGTTFRLADEKGKTLVIYFWGPWCGPCVSELGVREIAFKSLLESRGDVIVLSLSQDDGDVATRTLLAQQNVWSRHAVIPFQSRIAEDYFVRGAGDYYVIDATGKVISVLHGHAELLKKLSITKNKSVP